MSEHVALILYGVLVAAFTMAKDEPELKQCGAENKPAADLLPADIRQKLADFYVERRDYLRETRPS
jgi:hypothetical protein